MRNFRAIFLAVILLPFSPFAQAQSALFDAPRLRLQCAEGGCLEGVIYTLGQLDSQQLPQEALNSQIAVIAAILFEAASGAAADLQVQIAQALRLLIRYSSDADQQQSLALLARQIAAGERDLFDLSAPFAVSPS